MAQARRARTRPRKRPQQARSRELVEAILAAAARVFVRRGYAHATTNRIAEAAGVSVGSLYQYFPSKDAIAVELLRRYRERLLDLVATHLGRVDPSEPSSLERAVRALLASLLHDPGIDPVLHRVLIEQVLRTDARAELRGFEERLEGVVAEALRAAGAQVRVPDVEVAAFVVVRVVLSLIHALVVDRPEQDRAHVLDELARLVVGYLAPGEKARALAGRRAAARG